VVALAAFPCVGAQSSGFLKPDVILSKEQEKVQDSSNLKKVQDFYQESFEETILSKFNTVPLSKEEEKLANLKKQVKQQEELVAKERTATGTAADPVAAAKAALRTAVQDAAETVGSAVNDVAPKPSQSQLAREEAAAGKDALEEMEKRHKAQQVQLDQSLDSYETMMTTMYKRAGAPAQKQLKMKIAMEQQRQAEALYVRQEKRQQLLKMRIECMATVPGDQSIGLAGVEKVATATNFKVCKSTQEKAKIRQDNKDQNKVAKCMQPQVEHTMQPHYQGLTPNEKAAAKKQTERFEQMRQQMVKKQQLSNDQILEQSFKCMDETCAAQPANAAESKEAQLRRFNSYQGCANQAVMKQFAGAMSDAFDGFFKNEQVEQKAVEDTLKEEEKEGLKQQSVDEQHFVDEQKEVKKHTVTEDAAADAKKAVLEASEAFEAKHSKKELDAAAQAAEAKKAKKAVQDIVAKTEKDFKEQDALVKQAKKAVIAAKKEVIKKEESKKEESKKEESKDQMARADALVKQAKKAVIKKEESKHQTAKAEGSYPKEKKDDSWFAWAR